MRVLYRGPSTIPGIHMPSVMVFASMTECGKAGLCRISAP